MKRFSNILILFCLFLSLSSISKPVFTELNPTGTYEYDHGNYGDGTVKVQKIGTDKINVSLFVVGGPPSHNMGELIEVLKIKNGVAIYKSGDCTIKFTFNSKAVKVTQTGFECGFGNGISANGYYKKTSSKVPNMDESY
jgi:hypothetical protein